MLGLRTSPGMSFIFKIYYIAKCKEYKARNCTKIMYFFDSTVGNVVVF